MPGNSRVWTTEGAVKIRDIRAGARVWSEVNGELRDLPITNWSKTGEQPVVELRTKNRIIRSSGNHPVLVRIPGNMTIGSNEQRRVRYGYKRADEIELGDHIVQVKSLPDQSGDSTPTGIKVSHAMMQWLGAMVGDGNITGSGLIRMAMPPADRCHDEYVGLAQDLFNLQSEAVNSKDRATLQVKSIAGRITIRERDFGFSTALWADALTKWGFRGTAKTKRVPGWVYKLRRDLRLAFIAGLVDSDGSVNKLGSLTFGLANESLTHDIRDLMIGCGIQCCNVRYGEVSAHRLPNPGRKLFYPYWAFTASSAKEVSKIPFSDWLYRERVESNIQRHRTHGFDACKTGLNPTQLGFYEVKSITVKGGEMLYDIEVNGGGHNFIADGVIVSNSTFQNMSEAREMAYESNIIPTQRVFSATLNMQLLEKNFIPARRGRKREIPDMSPLQVYFDNSNVRVLQEDENSKFGRYNSSIASGWMRVAEARRANNLVAVEMGRSVLENTESG